MKGIVKLFLSICLVMGMALPVLAEPGVTDSEILIGSSLVLEGPTSYLGIQTNHGMMAYINKVNDEGGVNGRKIKVIAYNDNYDPLTCVQNTQKLITEDNVFALSCYVGTPTSVKAQPVWTNTKVPLTGFFTGAEALRTPFNRQNVHIRASYYQEAATIVDALVKQLALKKIAVFYQYDAFGEAVKKGTEIALEKYGIVPVEYASFERGTVNIEDGLKKIVEAQPEAVVMVGTYAPLARFVIAAKAAGLTKTIFHTVSFVGPEALVKELGTNTNNVVVTLVIPPYTNLSVPVVAEYNETLLKYFPNDSANFVSLEGFINAKVLVEGLKRAGNDLTREKYLDAIETIKAGEMKTGLGLNYGPTDHVGLDKVYIGQVKDGKFVEVANLWDLGK